MSKLPKILLVDDDKKYYESVKQILYRKFKVLWAKDEKSAFLKIKKYNFSLILLDLDFKNEAGDKEGIYILENILTTYAQIPIIIVSSTYNIMRAAEAVQMGAVTVVQKTVNNALSLLRETVIKTLNESKLIPIALLAFANGEESRELKHLYYECKYIEDTLRNKLDRNLLKIEKQNQMSIWHWSELIKRYRNQIIFFHFGGHSNGGGLKLEGEEQAHKLGLVSIFGNMANLEFIFLNGCANNKMVADFLSAGVNAVIATSVAINDVKAYEFAKQFYDALKYDNTLEDAFNLAKGQIETKYNNRIKIKKPTVIKGLKLRKKLEKAEEFEWGLYANNDDALKWKLPSK